MPPFCSAADIRPASLVFPFEITFPVFVHLQLSILKRGTSSSADRLQDFVDMLRADESAFMPLVFVKQGEGTAKENRVLSLLVEDRTHVCMSYLEFMNHCQKLTPSRKK